MRKEPYTNVELFKNICQILKENGNMPDILDYALPARKCEVVKTDEFTVRSNLEYGGSEGIYLDLYLQFYKNDGPETMDFGTCKTLYTNREAMRSMGKLLADFIVDTEDFVMENRDDFIWEGAGVSLFNKEGEKYGLSLFYSSVELAIKRAKENPSYPKIVIKDYVARTETTLIQ